MVPQYVIERILQLICSIDVTIEESMFEKTPPNVNPGPLMLSTLEASKRLVPSVVAIPMVVQ